MESHSPRRGAALVAVFAVASALAAPVAAAETGPPRFADGFGLTVTEQPTWVDDHHRTFTFAARSDQVPTPSVLPGQTPGQHVVMVTLPVGYDGAAATRYPVLYSLHGNADLPNTQRNLDITESSTRSAPLITVHPNGGAATQARHYAQRHARTLPGGRVEVRAKRTEGGGCVWLVAVLFLVLLLASTCRQEARSAPAPQVCGTCAVTSAR